MEINYQKICSKILEILPERTKDIIKRRFGLNYPQKETLESIGKNYNLTRERVRQIVEDGLHRLKTEEILKITSPVFEIFQDYLKKKGGLKKEEILLKDLGDEKFKHQVFFLLTLGEQFLRYGETENYYAFWAIDQKLAIISQKIIKHLIKKLQQLSNPITKDEFFQKEINELKNEYENINLEFLNSSYEISKKIEENAFGEIGLVDWPEIIPRGIKDLAYLVFKKENKPLHFQEIAKKINQLNIYPKKLALVQTVHNELIKDPRFVLIGRGIYALSEWGYYPGQVKDVIAKILKETGKPLTKEEILEKVLSQRIVKESTILLNLSNKKYFIRNSEGKYLIKEA